MMSTFLARHRDELIERCADKAGQRPLGQGIAPQRSGIPLFMAQLQRTLEAEERHQPAESRRISGTVGGDGEPLSEMEASATQHGRELLELGFAVHQVVHGYGDLCQAVTDLAHEMDAPFTVSEFRTLNRCLDNVIASAVTSFSLQREASLEAQTQARATQRMEALLHSLRSSLATATYATTALELGNLPISGATGSVLKTSLKDLRTMLGIPVTEPIAD